MTSANITNRITKVRELHVAIDVTTLRDENGYDLTKNEEFDIVVINIQLPHPDGRTRTRTIKLAASDFAQYVRNSTDSTSGRIQTRNASIDRFT